MDNEGTIALAWINENKNRLHAFQDWRDSLSSEQVERFIKERAMKADEDEGIVFYE